jgi:hypothetical protein
MRNMVKDTCLVAHKRIDQSPCILDLEIVVYLTLEIFIRLILEVFIHRHRNEFS